jgi:hypothetical protein
LQNGIAIISIAATATVAIAVPIINARAERTRLRGRLQTDRLDELRTVLDSAALALTRADELLGTAELAVETSQAADADESEVQVAEAALSEVDQALREVSNQKVRMSIRVGHKAQIVTTYGQAFGALLEERDVLTDTFHGGPLSDDPKGWREVVVPLHSARQNFEGAQQAVSDLAAQLISPFSDVGSRPHGRPLKVSFLSHRDRNPR